MTGTAASGAHLLRLEQLDREVVDDPDTPVNAVIAPNGIVTSTPVRLFSRAPTTTIPSPSITAGVPAQRRWSLLLRLLPGCGSAGLAALHELPPAGRLDLDVVRVGGLLDPLPRLRPFLVGHPFDLIEPGDRVADVASVDERLLALVGKGERLPREVVLLRRGEAWAL